MFYLISVLLLTITFIAHFVILDNEKIAQRKENIISVTFPLNFYSLIGSIIIYANYLAL